jgi:hypothetical protein
MRRAGEVTPRAVRWATPKAQGDRQPSLHRPACVLAPAVPERRAPRHRCVQERASLIHAGAHRRLVPGKSGRGGFAALVPFAWARRRAIRLARSGLPFATSSSPLRQRSLFEFWQRGVQAGPPRSLAGQPGPVVEPPVARLPRQRRVASAEDFRGHLICLDAKWEELPIVALLANDDPVHLVIEGEASELRITAGSRVCIAPQKMID